MMYRLFIEDFQFDQTMTRSRVVGPVAPQSLAQLVDKAVHFVSDTRQHGQARVCGSDVFWKAAEPFKMANQLDMNRDICLYMFRIG